MWSRRSQASVLEPASEGRVLAVLDGGGRAAERLRALRCGAEIKVVDHLDDAVKLHDEGAACVLVLGTADATPELLTALGKLRGKAPLPSIVMADRPTATLLRNALRAGVTDVVSTTSSDEDLIEALEQAWDSAAPTGLRSAKDGRVVAVFSAKGGVGCTTLAVNLGALLTAAGQSCVVIDADLPFGDVAVVLGVEPRNGLADLTGADLDTERMSAALATHGSGLKVIPGPADPAQAELITPTAVTHILDLVRTVSGTTIVDTSCAFDDVTLAILETADEILLVTTPDLASVKNAKVAQSTFRMLGIADSEVRLIVNRAGGKSSLGVGEIESQLGPAFVVVPEDEAFGRAASAGTLGVVDLPRNPVTKALGKLAERVTAGGR